MSELRKAMDELRATLDEHLPGTKYGPKDLDTSTLQEEAQDRTLISVPVGHREAFELFDVGHETYAVWFLRWDASGGVSEEVEVARGDAHHVTLALADAVRAKEFNDARMEAQLSRSMPEEG